MENDNLFTHAVDTNSTSRSHLGLRATPHERPEALPQERCFKIRAAESLREQTSAHLLVERMYATRGYQTTAPAENESCLKKTFLASDHNSAVGTLTIGLDSDEGLVVDQLFPFEVETLRRTASPLCEFTRLAMDRRVSSVRVLAALFHVAHIYSHRIKALGTLLIEVNPRHVKYYETMLGFKVIGSESHNPRVNAPAVLLALDLAHAQDQIERFGGQPELVTTERSAYPHFFSSSDEVGIVGRLRREDVDIADVSETQRVRKCPGRPTVPLH